MLVKKLVYAYITIIAVSIYTVCVPYFHSYVAGDLQANTIQGGGQGMVSITFDDGWESQYTYALPVLLQYHLSATFYIVSGLLGTPQTLTKDQVSAINNDGGNEIAAHTLTHPDLTKLSPAQVDFELSTAKHDLEAIIHEPVTDFATPYGRFDSKNIPLAMSYYTSIRSTQDGYNDPKNTNPYNLIGMTVTSDTTLSQLQSWITQAQQTHTWLILIYHMVNPDTPYRYNAIPQNFAKQMQLVRESDLRVQTIKSALSHVHVNINSPLDTCHTSACDTIIQGAVSE